ncbi:MAG: primosomal protein N' [Ktedonobacterales bacterium]
MRAEILVPQSSAYLDARLPLLTYHVPETLARDIAVGQIVSVPFGERSTAGLVWALDTGEQSEQTAHITNSIYGPETIQDSEPQPPLRSVTGILMREPLILPSHRALAEWLADHYAAPLASAARLLLPPGLLSTSRQRLRLGEAASLPTNFPVELSKDEDILLGILRERGWLDRDQVNQVLGKARARQVIHRLWQQRLITLNVELARTQTGRRPARYVRLAGTPEALETWRSQAHSQLDTLPNLRPWHASWQRLARDEKLGERLLRQLATLDLLEGRPKAEAEDRLAADRSWRIEELRKLTQITPSALQELVNVGLVKLDEVQWRHDPLAGRQIARTEPLALSAAQSRILAAVTNARCPSPEPGEPSRVFLLHGITGSGKTEIYLQALAATLAQGGRGIVLVPEIALTPQAMARFAGRFPGRVALLHSGLTSAERLDEWRRIRAGEVDIVLGSRSALFAPVDRLALIVVDEEHEAAYKQDRTPTYHAREVAVALGRLTGATVVLGSATPSVESYWLASHGVYTLLELGERAPTGAVVTPPISLPPVRIVDLRAELRSGNTSILSAPLRLALRQTLDRGEQAILFLNRRGSASSVVCRDCGYVARCGRCDVSMTYHASNRIVLCHYCGKNEPVPVMCPHCGSASIRHFGLGTERVEATVKRLFPDARVLRWDRDTARTRAVHEELLRAFVERRADVLVGTQMIAKGLDLPAVTLVGVISADVALFLPDFRASERAFALLTQVAGRAGRGNLPGNVLVQTLNPDHFCIQSASRHDYASFFAAEVSARRRYGYPPFRRFVKCTYEHSDRYTAEIEATRLADRFTQLIQDAGLAESDIVGPAPAFIERLRSRYRWQLILRSPDPRLLLRALTQEDLPAGWSVDIDPTSTL